MTPDKMIVFRDRRATFLIPSRMRRKRVKGGYYFESRLRGRGTRRHEILSMVVEFHECMWEELMRDVIYAQTDQIQQNINECVVRRGPSSVRDGAIESLIAVHCLETGERHFEWDVLCESEKQPVYLSVRVVDTDAEMDMNEWEEVLRSFRFM